MSNVKITIEISDNVDKKLHISVINSKNDIEERAKHFINFFGDYSLTTIQKERDGGNYFIEELFEKVEEMLQK
jgi:hypothetical protein